VGNQWQFSASRKVRAVLHFDLPRALDATAQNACYDATFVTKPNCISGTLDLGEFERLSIHHKQLGDTESLEVVMAISASPRVMAFAVIFTWEKILVDCQETFSPFAASTFFATTS
jgi:hypothetical protein